MKTKNRCLVLALGAALLLLACGNGQQAIPLMAYDTDQAATVATPGTQLQWLPATPELLEPFTATGFSGLYYNNLTWVVSIATMTGGCLASKNNVTFATTCAGDTGHGFVSMKVPADSMGGAELVSFRKTNYHYGLYEARMKLSPVGGVCDAFFWQSFNGDTTEEIDVELLTNEFTSTTGKVHYCLHPKPAGMGWFDPKFQQIADLAFNPGAAFHVYGFHYTADSLTHYVDGVQVAQFTRAGGARIPKNAGKIWLNCWTGSVNWGGGPPTQDATMVVDWVKFWPEQTTGIASEAITLKE
jgi:beta-glucanase (GH16 family)